MITADETLDVLLARFNCGNFEQFMAFNLSIVAGAQ
jgi:hypothetical protein